MKVVKVVLCTLLTLALGIGIMNFNDNPQDEYEITQKYNSLTNSYSNGSTLQSVQDTIDNPNVMAAINTSASGAPAKNVQEWMDCAKRAHNAFRAEGFDYAYGTYDSMSDGTRIRKDCSGYVSYALYLAGFTQNSLYGSSEMDLAPLGFTNIGPGSSVQIEPGDILVYGGHIHIAMSKAGTEVYNWGSHSSAAAPYGSATGNECFNVDPRVRNSKANSSVVKVWRLTKGSKNK